LCTMPVSEPAVAFRETDRHVHFEVALKTRTPDFVSTACYVKITQGMFVTELDLISDIIDSTVAFKVNELDGVVLFTAEKQTRGLWGALAHVGKPTPDTLLRRETAFNDQRAREAQSRHASAQQRVAAEKRALAQQISLESDHRQLIETKQKSEKEEAEVRLSAERRIFRQMHTIPIFGSFAA
jgi:hypothetical protein